jgi:PhnB protein
MASANPYLNFPGTCEEAFAFYKSVLGGEFSNVTKFADMPSGAAQDESHQAVPDGIMHISLPFGDSILMGSDVPPGMGTVTPGSTCYVCLSPDSPEEGKRVFEALSEGGEVEMAYDKQVWGDWYGSFTDRFGIRWMVDVGDPELG